MSGSVKYFSQILTERLWHGTDTELIRVNWPLTNIHEIWYWGVLIKPVELKSDTNNGHSRIWGCHSGGCEEFYLLRYNAMWSVKSQPTFRRNMSPPSFRVCLPPAFTPVSCSAYSSILKMEATCSSEKSVDFQRTTQRYIPEDITFQGQCMKTYGRRLSMVRWIWGVLVRTEGCDGLSCVSSVR
jgi:hypothetical protein